MADGLNPLGAAAIDTGIWRHLADAVVRRHADGSAEAKAEANGEAKNDALDPRRAVQAAKDFESVLLHQVLREMRKTVPDSGLLSDGTSEQMQSMFWMFLSQHMADQGGLGLWKDIYRQTLGADEVPQETSTVEYMR